VEESLGNGNGGTIYAGELEIHPAEGLALATGQALTLSVREFELLVAMAKRLGTIVTREELYRVVWGGELRAGDRSVDVYVSKLRTKLEAAMPDRRFIHTHPGFGYRFQPQPVAGGGSAALPASPHAGGAAAPVAAAPRMADRQPQPSRNFHTAGAVD
jgi:DNA-binding winged helix-turn-helix (wHTH) protein